MRFLSEDAPYDVVCDTVESLFVNRVNIDHD